MKAIAVDDELSGLKVIELHSSKVPFIKLEAQFVDVYKALDYLQKEKIDLIFLDIKMPDISGIEFYKFLNPKPLLIFTTAYSEHAIESFELDAVDYLLKPFSFSRFLKSCYKAYELYNLRNSELPPDFLFIKQGYETLKIQINDIYYLEASGNYVFYFLKDNKISSRNSFIEALKFLPEGAFIQIHRSFSVAVNKIEKIDNSYVTVNRTRIPIGKAFKINLKNKLMK